MPEDLLEKPLEWLIERCELVSRELLRKKIEPVDEQALVRTTEKSLLLVRLDAVILAPDALDIVLAVKVEGVIETRL